MAESTNPQNHRKNLRIKTELAARAKPMRRNMFEASVVNLSESGAFLVTDQHVMIGSEIILNLTFDISGETKCCTVQAGVVWGNTNASRGSVGYGVIFQNCSRPMLRLIQNYVATNLTAEVSATAPKLPGRGQLRG